MICSIAEPKARSADAFVISAPLAIFSTHSDLFIFTPIFK
jgi:hypothetical protein